MAQNPAQIELREAKFVEALIGDGQGQLWKAAQLAGHTGTKKSLQTLGSRLMARPRVQELLKTHFEKVEISTSEILLTLREQMRGNVMDYIDIDEHGQPVVRLEEAKADARLGRRIQRVTVKTRRYDPTDAEPQGSTETTVGLECYNAQGAAKILAQTKGLLLNVKDLKININMNRRPRSDEERIKEYERLEIPIEAWPPGLRTRHQRRLGTKPVASRVIEHRKEQGK
jgi:hypothetical protein